MLKKILIVLAAVLAAVATYTIAFRPTCDGCGNFSEYCVCNVGGTVDTSNICTHQSILDGENTCKDCGYTIENIT